MLLMVGDLVLMVNLQPWIIILNMASDVVFRYDAGFKYTLNYASTLEQTKAWSPTENHSTTMATP